MLHRLAQRTQGLLAAALVAALLAAPAAAQAATPGIFGTAVRFGDNDFVPTMAALPAGQAPFVCQVNFGDPASIQDDGFYLVFRAAAPAAGALLANNDLRLVPPAGLGKVPGTVVSDADTVEKGTGFSAACWAPAFGRVDANTNARYDEGDWVILDSAANALTNAPAGQAVGYSPGDIRLTRTGDGLLPGSLVLAGQSDVVARGGAFAAGAGFPAMALAWHDGDNSATFNGLTDRLYASTSAAGGVALVRIHDVRLYGDAGSHGSQVRFGDRDFVPTLGALPGAQAPFVCQVNYGDPASIQDDGFYLVFRAAAPAAGALLANNDLRLVPPAGMGQTPGRVLTDADTVEKATPIAAACWAPVLGRVDANTDARYDAGDWLLLDSGAAATLVNAPAGTAAGFTPGDLRVTRTEGNLLAGTLVLAGQSDVVARGGAYAAGAGFPAMALAWYDNDLSGTFNGLQDRLYASTSAALGIALVAISDVRLYGDAGQYGSQVQFADRDFVPTVAALPGAQAPFVCQVNFGDPASIQDDGFYLVFRAGAPVAGAFLANNDLRLVPPAGMGRAPGTLLVDADTVEKGTGFSAACWAPAFGRVDANTNARHDEGDWVILDSAANALTNAPAGQAAGFTPGDLRLTATQGGLLAGSLVLAGQADVVARGGAFAAGPGFPAMALALHDGDLSATWNGLRDRLYVSTSAAAGVALPRLQDVRLHGDFGGVSPPPPPPPPPPKEEPEPEPEPQVPEASALVAQLRSLGAQLNESLAQRTALDARVGDLTGQLAAQTSSLQQARRDLAAAEQRNEDLERALAEDKPAPALGVAAVLAALGAAVLVLRRKR